MAKLKLAVALNNPNGRLFRDAFDNPQGTIDPITLIRSADVVPLDDADKENYIVLKFAYALFDPKKKKVGLFSRVPGRHSNLVANNSVLVSSGVESHIAAHRAGGDLLTNSFYPLSMKLGVYANDFHLPAVRFKEFSHPSRFYAFVARRMDRRYYGFFIHVALLLPGSRFPIGRFPLQYDPTLSDQPPDEFQGFFSLNEADQVIKDENLSVDRYAVAMLNNTHKNFHADGVKGCTFSPRWSVSGAVNRIATAIFLKPSFCGMGIDVKELIK